MRKHGRIFGLILLAVVGIFSTAAANADETASSKIKPWKPEDFIYSEAAGQMDISPDAMWVVWVKSRGDKDKDARVSNLVLTSLTEKREIALTRGNDNNSQPKWSPDGETIAFVSNRARIGAKSDTASTQIWLINPRGGEPWVLSELARGPQQMEWLDKDTLIFSAQEDSTLFEKEAKDKKDDSLVVDDADHEPPVRLFKISVKDKKVTRLTMNTDWIQDWSVSRDGRYVAAEHTKSLHYTFDQKTRPEIVLHDLKNGTDKLIQMESRVVPTAFAWATDGSGFYVGTPFSTHPKFLTGTITVLFFYDVNSGKATQVPLDWDAGLGYQFEAVPGGFVTTLLAGARSELARFSAQKNGDAWSWTRQMITGENARNLESLKISEDGKMAVYSSSTASKLPQLFRAQLDSAALGAPTQISQLNDVLVTGRAYSKTEVIRWKGANDEEVEGILYYPTHYEAGKKYPVITAIHGGPMGADHDLWGESWAYPLQLLTQRGAFVLRPNYHGSSSYGLKWAESICCGKYYDLETPDINAGVDFLISKGLVDANQVGTMGWSNGSILSTSLLVTYPDRYKVGSVGAGDVEWISDWGNVKFGDSFDSYYFGKSPMEDPQLYIKKSPLFKMDKMKAPILIFHGTADDNVPTSQSWTYFRALQYYDKVPVKLVLFPGEPHGPRKLTHQMRKVEEEVAWFDRYFFKTEKPSNEALKQGSPLEAAFRVKDVVKTGGHYGTEFKVKNKIVLIPEVVKRGNLEVGRFEVTRAQFAEFDKTYRIEAGTENFPANGISFDQAKAYAEWLSKTTGQSWRLPTETESAAWYEKKDGENTLDYWAGYSLNPDDAGRLTKKVAELGSSAPLLKPVGSFAGQGAYEEALIFDLGGNVAEWVVTANGSGKAAGGSADQPVDARASHQPNPEYTGLRVVRAAEKSTAQK